MSNRQRYTCGAVAAFALLLSAPLYGENQITVEQCTDEWEDSTAYADNCNVGGTLEVEVTPDDECDITATCSATFTRTYVIQRGDADFCEGGTSVPYGSPRIGQTCSYEERATSRENVTAPLDDVSDLVICTTSNGNFHLATSC